MTVSRSSSLMPPHATISSSVRQQPRHTPRRGSMVQILIQGLLTTDTASTLYWPVRRAYRLSIAPVSFGSSGNSVSSHSLAFS
jgi:hypothetical protein